MYNPDYKKIDLFKYQLYQTKLDVDVENIIQYCLHLKNTDKGRVISNLCGWQSNDLEEIPESIQKLKELIELNLNYYGRQLYFNKQLYLDNMWININEYKDSNKPHMHPKSVLSGVFYLNVHNDTGTLKFYNPLSELIDYVLNDNLNKYMPENCCTWTVIPNRSMLLLFPSWLQHSVEPNLNKNIKRISISFNSKF